MNNIQIAAIFQRIADLLQLNGESGFTIRAYQRAARTIGHMSTEMAQMIKDDVDLQQIPGIGTALSRKINEMVTTGRLEYFESLKEGSPKGILTLMEVPGIGPKTALRISKEFGISSLESLEEAIVTGKMEAIPGFGSKPAENILGYIRSLPTKDMRSPMGLALSVSEQVISLLKESCLDLRHIDVVGSLRRRKETIRDITVIGSDPNPREVIQSFVNLPLVRDGVIEGSARANITTHSRLKVHLRMTDENIYGAVVQHFTGSREHNMLLRALAKEKGFWLNDRGVTSLKTGNTAIFADEMALYSYLDLQFIPPELREGTHEIDLASSHTLPDLVDLGQIRGDLHCHTNESDGSESVATMVEAARQLGYEYVAITDHSAGRGIANGLNQERLRRHVDNIRSLDRALNDINVLAGSEVDIRADGSLDYPDELLAQLDVVIASVHSAMGQDIGKMTDRIIKAIRNPNVDIIGHLTCRLLGSRNPVNVDVESIFRAAMETGTALEINASPERMDLKDIHVLQARDMGVPLVINTDAHAPEHLDFMRLGIAIARRGQCESKDILNTRPVSEFLSFLHSH